MESVELQHGAGRQHSVSADPSPRSEPRRPSVIRTSHETRTRSSSRRVQSYFNAFQTACYPSMDAPPAYAAACQQPRSKSHLEVGTESLPRYSCTVSASGRFHLRIESISPLHVPCDTNPWREVYLVLRGTLLSIHRVKNSTTPGRLLRTFNLQHAEVGLASDTEYAVLVPRRRWAALIPSSARRRAWLRDPELFDEEPQHAFRLRAELDQLVFAHRSEDFIYTMINTLSAAIDVAPGIDERSVPRQCTIPRRRRRQHGTARSLELARPSDLTDPIVIAEQERLLRQLYPGFAEVRQQQQQQQVQVLPGNRNSVIGTAELALGMFSTSEQVTLGALEDISGIPPTPSTEEEDFDLTVIRDEQAESPSSSDGADSSPLPSPTSSQQALTPITSIASTATPSLRPYVSRQTTATSVISIQSADISPSPSSSEFSETAAAISANPSSFSNASEGDVSEPAARENIAPETGKWHPHTTRTPSQRARYIRRCVPILLLEAPRASPIFIGYGGRRVKLCAERAALEDWRLKPPAYELHSFAQTDTEEVGIEEVEALELVEEIEELPSSGGLQEDAAAAGEPVVREAEEVIGAAGNQDMAVVAAVAIADVTSANVPAHEERRGEEMQKPATGEDKFEVFPTPAAALALATAPQAPVPTDIIPMPEGTTLPIARFPPSEHAQPTVAHPAQAVPIESGLESTASSNTEAFTEVIRSQDENTPGVVGSRRRAIISHEGASSTTTTATSSISDKAGKRGSRRWSALFSLSSSSPATSVAPLAANEPGKERRRFSFFASTHVNSGKARSSKTVRSHSGGEKRRSSLFGTSRSRITSADPNDEIFALCTGNIDP